MTIYLTWSTGLNGDGWQDVTDRELRIRARHLIPCRLRVVSYSRDDGCLPDFPTIYFEGDTGMEAWHENSVDEESDNHVCFLDGSASMLADGSVRWSFVRTPASVILSFMDQ